MLYWESIHVTLQRAANMEIKLSSESRISEVKDSFHREFPFLKLEFFNPLANENERFHIRNLITDEYRMLGEIAGMQKPGYVRIYEHRTVAEVEHCFRDCFGLYVQVFRKSGDQWIETTSTDSRTLAEQNKEGEEKSVPLKIERSEEDIHEQA